MTRNEHEYYANIDSIAKALDRIANALENNNKEDKIYYKTRKDMFADNPCTKEEYDEQIASNKVDTEELDTQHDYLHGLVQDLDSTAFLEFCNEHCLPTADAVAVSNYITDLDYDECLSIISDLEARVPFPIYSNDLSIRYKNKIKEFPKVDNDDDIRKTARMYDSELLAGNFKTKKDAILDYVTNEFGSHGARYTDIIKFAYYLGAHNAPKYTSENRGYYAMAFASRYGGHLIQGGKDYLVKGINKEGKERYFALSFVESATDYWKRID